MCGIAGLILSTGAPPPDPVVISRLIDSLHHRGPDGTGHAVVGRVALMQNRLAIIDLVTGDQPFFAGSATLVANGEVYNYRELRNAMPAVNYATNSDCEPPLYYWLRDGPDYARELRGMYAIAIHERQQHLRAAANFERGLARENHSRGLINGQVARALQREPGEPR